MCFLKTFCPQELTFNHNCFLESSSLAYTTCSATSLDTTGRQVPCNWYAMLPRLTTKKYELHIIAKSHRIHVWCIHIYIYANLGGILMVNVTIYSIHGSYGKCFQLPGILPDLSRSRENTSSLTIPNNPSGNLLHSY